MGGIEGILSEEELEVYEYYAEELMKLPEKERVEYCKRVIEAVVDALVKVKEVKAKVEQYKRAKKLYEELHRKRFELLPVFLYTIKPEFRDTYLDLLEKLGSSMKV